MKYILYVDLDSSKRQGIGAIIYYSTMDLLPGILLLVNSIEIIMFLS